MENNIPLSQPKRTYVAIHLLGFHDITNTEGLSLLYNTLCDGCLMFDALCLMLDLILLMQCSWADETSFCLKFLIKIFEFAQI